MSKRTRRLRRQDIDVTRWDKTASANSRGFPYGQTWWMDAVTEGRWEGIVLDDYRLVLPLPIHLRIGPLALINGAPYTQHFGPYGEGLAADNDLLLRAVPSRYFVRKLALRHESGLSRLSPSPRTNYELALAPGYKAIAAKYRADLRRKLRRTKLGAPIVISAETFTAFYRANLGRTLSMNDRLLTTVDRLLQADATHGAGKCYGLYSTDGDELLATLFLARQHERLINLMATSSSEGFRLNAMAVLIDGIIREYAGQDLLFDFEGSDLEGVASFFRSFGASALPYQQYQDKRLLAINFP